MAITPIDSTTVAVYSFSDLSAVLENTGSAYTAITKVILAADITLTDGINLSTARSSLTIDGRDPFDPAGATIHSVTDMQSSDTGKVIGLRTGGYPMAVTYQNLNWTGYNYYGVFYTPGGDPYNNVSITLSKVNYSGPQLTYHHAGLTRLMDCTVTIIKNYSDCQEVCEVCRLEIGGETSITHTDPIDDDSMFWFWGTAPSFTILPDANVTLNTLMDVYYTWAGDVPFTVSQNATLIVNTQKGFCRDSGHKLASVTVGAGATLRIIQGAASGSATLHCDGAFTVNQGADVSVQAAYGGASPLISFYTASAALLLNNPKSFALYCLSASAFAFSATTSVSMLGQQFNYWSAATAFPAAGTLSDIPQYSWRRGAGGLASISGTASGGASNLSSSDFSDDDLAGKPLSNMRLQSVRVFSVGNLPLSTDVIAADGYPVTGETLPGAAVGVSAGGTSYTGRANADGAFSVETALIPVEAAVTVAANIPFLITSVTRSSLDPGELTLSAPGTMVFILNAIARDPSTLYGREDPAWALTVTDSRVHSTPWALYAAISGPLTSEVNALHTVPGALVNVDQEDLITPLGGAPLLIHTGDANGGSTKITPVSWEMARGILLRAVGAPYFNREQYRTDIVWTLQPL